MTTVESVSRRPPPWRNVRVLRIAFQVAFVAVVALLLLYLFGNLNSNLRRLRIDRSFDYLSQPAGFAIPDSDFRSTQSLFAALLVGVKNTAYVSLLGIGLATILGVVVGVARLSSNWLVRHTAALYVETLRNVPVLLILLFWYLGVLLRLPPIGRAVDWQVLVLSNRGLVGPGLRQTGDPLALAIVVVLGIVSAAAVWVWRTRRYERTGEPHHRVVFGGGVLAAFLVIGYLATGQPLAVSFPERGELATTGGFRLSPEYAALLVGLTLYTASHIAEIVRGSILSVPRGQTESADAIALSSFDRLRFVVLPQAFRVAIPPVGNQYLNLVKNSSLGVAIAFPEATRITRITISQGGPAPQAILVLMGVYLVFSLSIALVVNLVNRRLALKGR
ncbi:MAG TPA: ABC transporter permease subunit [Gaiellaceae bacterium]|nr:ABC transporter permease subunit [Gaiellaceae bacterium]